ncbi:MAG: tRNA (guanosine(46)-N7)-methyltransferase TrmB [Magnetococcales bacterium]|nr:tRNA (guanosine(46)-N7)-methyltransferase TrmB [Magnetococcales bacterium]
MTDPTTPSTTDPNPLWKPKVHGRKRGFVTPREKIWLDETLPLYHPPRATSRTELLGALGADPERARLIVEIGFGNGQFLGPLAARHPEDRFIGIEVFQEGLAGLIRRLQRDAITNTRILPDDARLALTDAFPDHAIDWVIINFPDPWPKKRHHKRRIVQSELLDRLVERMRPGGLLTLATDWAEYAEWMFEVLEAHPGFVNLAAPERFTPRPDFWIETRFEAKGVAAGRTIHHLAWRNQGGQATG